MTLDCGVRLRRLTVAYRTYGTLNAARSNAVLVCHALTADQYVADRHPLTGKEGWWDVVVGPGRPIDTGRYFVICANVLGGCMGSTGPRSLRDDDTGPWGTDFPPVTIHDMVRAQKMLIDHLGITRLFAVLGGSMGGMQVLQWAASYPDAVFAALPIACAAYHSAQNIAFHEVGRQAIFADPDWQGGRYWASGCIPARGLAVARMCAHITYLSEEALTRQVRPAAAERAEGPERGDRPVRRDVRGAELSTAPGIHVRAAVRCQFVSDDHAGDGLLRPGGGLRRRRAQCVQGHEDAVPADVVHLGLAVPDGGKPRDRTGAQIGQGRTCRSSRSPPTRATTRSCWTSRIFTARWRGSWRDARCMRGWKGRRLSAGRLDIGSLLAISSPEPTARSTNGRHRRSQLVARNSPGTTSSRGRAWPQHRGGSPRNPDAAVRPATRVKLGSALAALARPLGGLDLDITRDRTPAKPPMLE